MKSRPKGYNTYSFVAEVNGKKMEFVSDEEYREYVDKKKPIDIISKTLVDYRSRIPFRMKIVLYRRTTDNIFFVYRVSQYFNNKPTKEVYQFKDYQDAFIKYKEIGGKI